MDEQEILKKLDSIKDIPTLPTIVFELNKLLRDPDTSIKTVCDTIEKDQAITLKILKLVNSAFYGFKSKIATCAMRLRCWATMRFAMPLFRFRSLILFPSA
jgi:HD-like signal output (HDOD) protein